MSVFLSAYDTLAGSGHAKKLVAIKDQLEVVKINGQYVQDENNENVKRVYDHNISELQLFTHPVIIPNKDETSDLFVDLRAFTHLDKSIGDFVIKINNEALFEINRVILNAVWVNTTTTRLLNLSPIPMIVFAGWISENVAKRFALTPKEQLALAIYSAYYYYCLFSDNDMFDSNDNNQIISSISRNLRCSALDVIEVVDRISNTVSDVKNFSETIPDVVQSVRLKNFNTPVLFQLLGNSWFGLNAREIIGAALEHPPTWIALVNSAYSDRTYKNTLLAKSAEKKASKAAIDSFIRAVHNLVTNV